MFGLAGGGAARTTGADYVQWVLGDRRPRGWKDSSQFLRVLCIDGGGIRGVIPALMLARMEARTGKRIADLFDIICGTSTGGLLTLGLTCPKDGKDWTRWPQPPRYTAEQLLGVYEQHGKRIFGRSKRHFVRSLGGLRRPSYETRALEGLLEEMFGDVRMRDAVRHALVTMYDSQKRQPYPLNSSTQAAPARKRGRGYDLPMKDVARATSAAPTYFAPHRVKVGGQVGLSALDGGVAANNPSLYGLLEAQSRAGDCSILMVSLGTGEAPEQFEYDTIRTWGMVRWLRPVIELLASGGSATTHQQLNFFINGVLPRLGEDQYQTGLESPPDAYDVNRDHANGSYSGARGRWTRYIRYQPALRAGSARMDDVCSTNILGLKEDAEAHLGAHEADFATLCDFLSEAADVQQVSFPDWDDSDPRKPIELAGLAWAQQNRGASPPGPPFAWP